MGSILGYKINKDNSFEIDEEGARTVRLIFAMFIDGYTYREIANYLIKNEHKDSKGNVKWDLMKICNVLKNEKYCGDIIFQKSYTPNYLNHKSKANKNNVSQFFIPEHHEPIIDKGTFMMVQLLKQRRDENYDSAIDNGMGGPLSGIVYCASCGRPMQKLIVHSGKPYQRTMLTCKRMDVKKNTYCNCIVPKMLDYEVTLDLVRLLVKDSYASLDFELINESLKEGKSKVKAFEKIYELNALITDKKNELNSLVSEATESKTPFKVYKQMYDSITNEILAIENEINEIKEKGFEAYDSINFNRDLIAFLENKKTLTARIVAKKIKRIFRLEDNSLLIVKSDNPLSIRRLEEIRESVSDYLALPSLIYELKDRFVSYRILEIKE
ncbi:MAG: recombinase family protein [Bacilli bacterium]|nr:recombinase family protein [Bacilli bacterium]